jgi:type I restriction enzyme M protein
VRKAHSIIWSGGKRDPLSAFDEWSKLLFAKVVDERTTPTGGPRQFQVGTDETETAVANRIHRLFRQGCRDDPTIFPGETKIVLSDKKIAEVVKSVQAISFTRTDVDSIGAAFERFFGSVFRGGLGQYFTRRELARFVVAMLDITHEDFVIDPTAGSGGFLLEALLQVWHKITHMFAGQTQQERLRIDFALQHVYGIEIHDTLARICKINLLLHHDGHTNIEGDRSALDATFTLPRLKMFSEQFSVVIGNPPFGDSVTEGDIDKLGNNQLDNFVLAKDRSKIDSEQAILERAIQMLEPGGRLGFVIPDGLLNNQGEPSNCPRTRAFLARSGRVFAVISLPDYAFRKSGAQNKTSVLFFQKHTIDDQQIIDGIIEENIESGLSEADAIALAYETNDHWVFLAEASDVGYTPSGTYSGHNDLYRDDEGEYLSEDQGETILGEYRRFLETDQYEGRQAPDCMAMSFHSIWQAHPSHRLDPKYHLFKHQEASFVPEGWIRMPIKDVMRRREDEVHPELRPDQRVTVMTLSQTGTIRPREAGKGRNPPEWLGVYFVFNVNYISIDDN